MLNIVALPALKDNYIWMICYQDKAIIIDPATAKPVLDFLAKNSLKPTACLLTHNHHDHTDGVAELLENYPQLAIYGSEEVSEWTTMQVSDGQTFELDRLKFEVLNSAGHTAGHISYLLNNEHLFCGDALFSGGCGRVFTGDYAAQFKTLQRFNALPDFVKIYAGHEYTLSNLKFAERVLAPSCVLAEYLERAEILHRENRPTLPSTIGIEKQINPFLQAVDLAQFIAIRQQKDRA